MSAIDLFCLPYAGGGAAVFAGWSRLLPGWVRVNTIDLPGHGSRRRDASLVDWDELTDWVVGEMGPRLGSPYAIFGHSMGALVGLEFAHAMRDRHDRAPVWFGASGCRAPSRRELERKWLTCEESELVAELRDLGGTPAELLAEPELLELVLPMLRSDFHLCGVYERRDRPRLGCPISVIAGAKDTEVSEPAENLADWGLETTGCCSVEIFDAGHFLLEQRRDEVLGAIVRGLANVADRATVDA